MVFRFSGQDGYELPYSTAWAVYHKPAKKGTKKCCPWGFSVIRNISLIMVLSKKEGNPLALHALTKTISPALKAMALAVVCVVVCA